jgi:hypothetical protein
MLIVFHTVQAFITTMDQLKLEMKAVDEVSSHHLIIMSLLLDILN